MSTKKYIKMEKNTKKLELKYKIPTYNVVSV